MRLAMTALLTDPEIELGPGDLPWLAGLAALAHAVPGWLNPSISTGSVTSGRGDAGRIVCGPGPGMANAIVSCPGLALASRIA